jgi:hypothetical protein
MKLLNLALVLALLAFGLAAASFVVNVYRLSDCAIKCGDRR